MEIGDLDKRTRFKSIKIFLLKDRPITEQRYIPIGILMMLDDRHFTEGNKTVN